MTPQHDDAAQDVATTSSAERERALLDRGVDAVDASIVAALTTGVLPASVLVSDAVDASGLAIEEVAVRVADELGVANEPGAAPRITRFLEHVRTARGNQAGRFSPQAVEALATVLDASREAFARAFEAAAAALESGPRAAGAGALAREGRAGVVIDSSRSAEDDDAIDALFNRSPR